jgi:D-alanyl-D-alanine carboxypeptidase/D-alanyl-D-alanine-endopeptidase (penicillin-binding protein 4)
MVTDRVILSRRALLTGLAASAAGPALASPPTRSLFPVARPAGLETPAPQPVAVSGPIRRPGAGLEDLLARSGLSGETALIALDAETGEIIEEHRANLLLPPASTAKAVTTLYALQILGAEHRFVTRVVAQGGSIDDGTLRGDLVLRGGGDPVLQTSDLARLADELIERGLRRVEGRFLVDEGALPTIRQIDPTQPVQAGYNPSISGINLNFNRVHFAWEVREGRASLSMDARSNVEVPAVSVIDIRAASRDLPVYTHDLSPQRERWTVAASALRTSGSRWLPVRRPGAYAGDVLRALLLSRGCRLPEPEVARAASGGAVLAEVRSGAMTEILRDMLRYSTNLTTECVGLSASVGAGHSVRSLEQSAARMNAWARTAYGAEGFRFIDHSGLGDGSRVAPRAMAQYLRSAWREGILPGLLRDHPMRDAQGQAQANHPVSVQAKTGTLNFVSALAGYAQPRGGRPIVFSIISADLHRRRAIADDDSEQPAGTRTWTRRARSLQQDLLERWGQAQG